MGSFRSKEDDVSKISTSIFVTNFPDSFSAKDLFHSCKQYGHVVDSFIPTKRTKDGKRFGFVRFINIFNVERLVNNLCTIWVGRSKFHANVARFKREYMKGSVNVDKTKNESNKRKFDGSHKNVENTVIGKSFVSVVKTSRMPIDKESPPAIVLEDDCLNAKDLTLSLMGRVKEMASLVNLKKALCNEGVNVGVGSWFSVIKQAYAEFVPEGRLVWVELDGVPFKFWSGPTFKRIAAKWGELLDVDDYDESNIHSKNLILLSVCEHMHESCYIVFQGKVYWVRASVSSRWILIVLETLFDQPDDQKDKHSEDPFGLYPLLNKENIELARKVTEEDHSLSHPPGFTPEEGLNEGNTVNLDMKDYGENERDDNSFVNLEDDIRDNSESVNKNSESKRSGHSKYSVLPRTGGSILNLMEEVVKVGQTMGLAQKAKKDWVKELCVKNKVNFVGLQETKMGSIDLSSVWVLWGVGFRDGTILFISSFVRRCVVESGIDLMIVVVYAPQEAKEKRMLWDYLAHVSNQWVGKLVMMGDFNEVRYKSDRYGSNFNAHDAEIFNSFIYNAGLDEVPLGGSVIPELIRKRIWKRMISKEEVKRAVWDCGVDKSSGLDGFSFSFYRHFWPVIEKDVFEAVDYFFMYGEIPDKKKHLLFFKVDFEKAFNSVRWDFVDDVLNKFGFGEKMEDLGFKVVLDHTGGPLSSVVILYPFFNSFFLWRACIISFQVWVDAGLFTGIKINSMVNLSHLFYADDAIFLGQWSELNIDSLVRVLDCFFRASGLRINMCKSKIMGVNVEDGMVKNAASKLGCLVLKTLSLFVTKVGGYMSGSKAWKEVVDSMVLSRLSRWKMKLLSIGGRLTLLKSVLGSMPIFHMSIFKVPSSILKSLESIRSRFFNGQDPKSNKASLGKVVTKVLTPKDKGGLGVSSLFALNRGLMLKWVWRFYSQKCSLWTKVIKAIYGEDGNLNKDVSVEFERWTSIVHVAVSSRAVPLDNHFEDKARNGIEEMQLNSLAEIFGLNNLVALEKIRYVWTLE
ncbi:RNA-directed DNA polymerase, eukaryota [Tanacetum coccineum]